jgi:flagellar biogenesis protein FliO
MDVVAEYGREILSLVAVFALLGWTVSKLGGGKISLPLRKSPKQKSIQTVERLMLTQQHTLHVVEIDGRRVLVATHPSGVTILDGQPEAQAGSAQAGSAHA